MKRVAVLALVAILTACGSDSNGPNEKFSGTWTGRAIAVSDTLSFVFDAAQNGSVVTGTGNISDHSSSEVDSFTGTSTPPSVALTIYAGSDTATYAGSYVSSDSISGIITVGTTSVPLDLAKH